MSEQNEQLVEAALHDPSMESASADPHENPALAYDVAHAEKTHVEISHDLGKMITEVAVTPENTPDGDEYARKKLDPLESQKDYSGQLLKTQKSADQAADVSRAQVVSAFKDAQRVKRLS
jgi:hypothetical protein